MSVSKWAYIKNRCDGDYCPGECDLCDKAMTILANAKEIKNGESEFYDPDNHAHDKIIGYAHFLVIQDEGEEIDPENVIYIGFEPEDI